MTGHWSSSLYSVLYCIATAQRGDCDIERQIWQTDIVYRMDQIYTLLVFQQSMLKCVRIMLVFNRFECNALSTAQESNILDY